MSYLLAEDAALKLKLEGLSVPVTNGGTAQVKVRFALSEDELAKTTYPLIMISHGNVSEASDRRHEGRMELPYSPDGQPAVDVAHNDTGMWTNFPIPVNIDYVVTTFTRTAMHDRLLTQTLAGIDYLPYRYGYLAIPEDGTVRRLDIIGGPEPEERRDSDNKRLFVKRYVVRISSELLLSAIATYTDVTAVDLDIDDAHGEDVYGI